MLTAGMPVEAAEEARRWTLGTPTGLFHVGKAADPGKRGGMYVEGARGWRASPANKCHYRVASGAGCVHSGLFYSGKRQAPTNSTGTFTWKALNPTNLGKRWALAFP